MHWGGNSGGINRAERIAVVWLKAVGQYREAGKVLAMEQLKEVTSSCFSYHDGIT